MLKTRVLTAIVALCVVLAALFLLPPTGFALTALLLLAVGAHEWARLAHYTRAAELAFVAVFLLVGLVLVLWPGAGFAAGWPPRLVLLVCGVATAFWVLVAAPWVMGRWQVRQPFLLALAGLVVLVGAFVALVQMHARSAWLLLASMAVVWIADTAAYFSGRAFGRHKLAPHVSPGKTWEGVAGALVAVGLYALLLAWRAPLLAPAVTSAAAVLALVVFVVAVAGLSVIGDLFESLQKRIAGVKDSGTLLPGHGGVLDRIDALLAAMPPLAFASVLALPQ